MNSCFTLTFDANGVLYVARGRPAAQAHQSHRSPTDFSVPSGKATFFFLFFFVWHGWQSTSPPSLITPDWWSAHNLPNPSAYIFPPPAPASRVSPIRKKSEVYISIFSSHFPASPPLPASSPCLLPGPSAASYRSRRGSQLQRKWVGSAHTGFWLGLPFMFLLFAIPWVSLNGCEARGASTWRWSPPRRART